MTVLGVLSWMITGLVVGMIARLLVPGRQRLGILMTMVLGIVGAIVGGFLYSLTLPPTGETFALRDDAWQGWIVSILGATLVIWLFALVQRREEKRRW